MNRVMFANGLDQVKVVRETRAVVESVPVWKGHKPILGTWAQTHTQCWASHLSSRFLHLQNRKIEPVDFSGSTIPFSQSSAGQLLNCHLLSSSVFHPQQAFSHVYPMTYTCRPIGNSC